MMSEFTLPKDSSFGASAQETADALITAFNHPEIHNFWEPLLDAELRKRGYDPDTEKRVGWLRRMWMKVRVS